MSSEIEKRKADTQMLKKIAGFTGPALWLVLIVVLVAFQTEANGQQVFENLPDQWKIEKTEHASPNQLKDFSRKLRGRIDELSNTHFSVDGQKIQINLIRCHTPADARNVYKDVIREHSASEEYVLLGDTLVVEFVEPVDASLVEQAKKVFGFELFQLDKIAKKWITTIPEDWKIEKSFLVPRNQTLDIAKRLGGRIGNLSNTIFYIDDKKFQVNFIECLLPRGAEKIYGSILKLKSHPAFCLKFESTVIEFVGDDVALALDAPVLLGFPHQTEPGPTENKILSLNKKVAKLNIKTAKLRQIYRIFGEPLEYKWSDETFEKDKLPERYIMFYPEGFHIFMVRGRINELRYHQPGYRFLGKFQVGSSLEDVIAAIGRPGKTVVGKPNESKNGVLYKDIDGNQGQCYYSREKKGVRCFFNDYRVSAIYVSRNDLSGKRPTKGAADIPDIPEQIQKAISEDAQLETMAQNLVNLLDDAQFEKATENFDATMKKALPPDQLKQIWDSLVAGVGPYQEQIGTRTEKVLQYQAVFVTCRFKNTALDIKVVFDSQKQITGLFFVPANQQ
jgi:regulator of replication initiation timing